MSDLRLTEKPGLSDKTFHVRLSLIQFEEDQVIIIYSPALDLSGYGHTQEEAKKSFENAFYKFLRYTNNKKTFEEVLGELGWNVEGGKKYPTYKPPLNSDLINKNPTYNEIVNSRDYTSYYQDVEFVL